VQFVWCDWSGDGCLCVLCGGLCSASSAERPDLIDVASQVERLVASP